MRKPALNLAQGQLLGHWEVLGDLESLDGRSYYLCRCRCGVERLVNAFALRKGTSKSCGCRKLISDQAQKASENDATSSEAQRALHLIHQGYLPVADLLTKKNGSPAWTLESIAIILGVTYEQLLKHIENRGQRF